MTFSGYEQQTSFEPEVREDSEFNQPSQTPEDNWGGNYIPEENNQGTDAGNNNDDPSVGNDSNDTYADDYYDGGSDDSGDTGYGYGDDDD